MSVLNPIRVMRTVAAAGLLAAAMLAVAALALPRGASAQAPPAPTLSAVLHADGVQMNWTFSGTAPRGWKHTGFVTTGWIDAASPWFSKDLPPTTRSYKDRLTEAQRAPGTKITVGVTPIFDRISDNARRYGRQATAVVVVPALPAAMLALPPPSLSTEAHADGVLLRWTYNVTAPAGWALSGFYTAGKIDASVSPAAPAVGLWSSPNLPATARSYKDPLTKTKMIHRMPGHKIKFEVTPLFRRLSDNAVQVGRSSAFVVFVAPALPSPNNFRISFREGPTSLFWDPPQQLTWSHPHLAWNSSTGFDKVSGYVLYRYGREVERFGPTVTSYHFVAPRCDHSFQMRAAYGLFVSHIVSPAEGRKNC